METGKRHVEEGRQVARRSQGKASSYNQKATIYRIVMNRGRDRSRFFSEYQRLITGTRNLATGARRRSGRYKFQGMWPGWRHRAGLNECDPARLKGAAGR